MRVATSLQYINGRHSVELVGFLTATHRAPIHAASLLFKFFFFFWSRSSVPFLSEQSKQTTRRLKAGIIYFLFQRWNWIELNNERDWFPRDWQPVWRNAGPSIRLFETETNGTCRKYFHLLNYQPIDSFEYDDVDDDDCQIFKLIRSWRATNQGSYVNMPIGQGCFE